MSVTRLSEPLQNILLQDLRNFYDRASRIATLSVSAIAAIKSAWTRGSPFAAATALYPTNDEGKYVIQAEGIRMEFTNYGGAVTNLWLNNSRGEEVDIVLGLDHARDYEDYPKNPYLNGAIGKSTFYILLAVIIIRSSADRESLRSIRRVHAWWPL